MSQHTSIAQESLGEIFLTLSVEDWISCPDVTLANVELFMLTPWIPGRLFSPMQNIIPGAYEKGAVHPGVTYTVIIRNYSGKH